MTARKPPLQKRKQQCPEQPYNLTPREITVLAFVVDGLTDKQIARELDISLLTVHKHVHHVLTKLGAPSRTEAAVRAVREQIIPARGGQPVVASEGNQGSPATGDDLVVDAGSLRAYLTGARDGTQSPARCDFEGRRDRTCRG